MSLRQLLVLVEQQLSLKRDLRKILLVRPLAKHMHFHDSQASGNLVISYYFSTFETLLGIILACGPAIRQFFAYRKRTKSYLPNRERQYPNEDFEKVRFRVNLRDIFWYRHASMTGSRVFEARPIFRSSPTPPPRAKENNIENTEKVSNSILDVWESRVKGFFGSGSSRPVSAAGGSLFETSHQTKYA